MVLCYLSINSYQYRPENISFIFSPPDFLLDLLVAYSKGKLKGKAMKHLLRSINFLIGNVRDKCLLTLTLLQASFKDILRSLNTFMGASNSMRTLYSTSLWTELQGSLKSVNNRHTVLLYFLYFLLPPGILWMQKTWSVVHVLHQNLHWYLQ